ncbi:MAG: bifunctional diaminohydroxyphosphoribosylaminopyrimidine deaminase/5-amino-6-(5-phosphoribosylamino)uracil reductase RibD [Dehalococcoidia bacterium]|nr:MAG: bifunctional diaminohydroxyphosphoribosylaminopyrimidine deaminase/5-amino-6-(5-phosphoribosylamino)uracil reductase RibD [Dehalococcoidia bacterium]
MNDEHCMRQALALARRGLGKTSPNPMVGAVIVRNGEIIGRGYHRRCGGNHAEIEAIHDAGEDINGATLYVTLEPCCHHGKKTPPCLDTLLKHELGRVVIGTPDPNPQVSGRSIEALRERGIPTEVGVLSDECRRLNEVYFKYIRTGTPFITLKFAQTLDGKIATFTGDSRWISSEPSLKFAHRLRSHHDAVLVGVGTVLKDDPELTVRLTRGRNPLRIVVDSSLRVPLGSRILKAQEAARTIVATTLKADSERHINLTQMGIETLTVDRDSDGKVDINDMLKKLGEMNISSVLVEGGAAISTSLVSQGLWDRLVVIIAPKILGEGTDSIGNLRIKAIENALKLHFVKTYRSGEDLIIEATPERP